MRNDYSSWVQLIYGVLEESERLNLHRGIPKGDFGLYSAFGEIGTKAQLAGVACIEISQHLEQRGQQL